MRSSGTFRTSVTQGQINGLYGLYRAEKLYRRKTGEKAWSWRTEPPEKLKPLTRKLLICYIAPLMAYARADGPDNLSTTFKNHGLVEAGFLRCTKTPDRLVNKTNEQGSLYEITDAGRAYVAELTARK